MFKRQTCANQQKYTTEDCPGIDLVDLVPLLASRGLSLGANE